MDYYVQMSLFSPLKKKINLTIKEKYNNQIKYIHLGMI